MKKSKNRMKEKNSNAGNKIICGASISDARKAG